MTSRQGQEARASMLTFVALLLFLVVFQTVIAPMMAGGGTPIIVMYVVGILASFIAWFTQQWAFRIIYSVGIVASCLVIVYLFVAGLYGHLAIVVATVVFAQIIAIVIREVVRRKRKGELGSSEQRPSHAGEPSNLA